MAKPRCVKGAIMAAIKGLEAAARTYLVQEFKDAGITDFSEDGFSVAVLELQQQGGITKAEAKILLKLGLP